MRDMNKIIIPTLFIALVIAAGFFAFSLVEQASTVHTQIINASTIPFKITCNEISLTGASDDGEITLDVNGNNPVIVHSIFFESGTGTGATTDANDTILITDIRVDTVTLAIIGGLSLDNPIYDAAPTEGELLSQIDIFTAPQNVGSLIADTDIGVTVDGTVNTDTTTYTVSFAGLVVSGDTAPTCDVTGVV